MLFFKCFDWDVEHIFTVVGCTDADGAREASNLLEPPSRGKTRTWPVSQMPLPITLPVLSKVTDIFHQAADFNQTPFLTYVALGTGGGDRKGPKPVWVLEVGG